jgi:class 3 adenylate cyclase
MHPVGLAFDDEDLESEFRQAHDRASLTTVRLTAVLAIVLYAAFAVLDTLVTDEGLSGLLLMRAGVITCITLALACTFHPMFPRFQQAVVCSGVLVAGLGMASMQVIAPVPDAMAAMGMMLTLMFLCSFVRVRFVPASITAALMVLAYEAGLQIAERSKVAITYLNFELAGFLVIGLTVCHTLERLWRQEFLSRREIEHERARSDALLHNVLPAKIASRLRVDSKTIAEAADDATVLFADIVGFTPLTEQSDPKALVAALDRLFAEFDALCAAEGVEKIKTIGDGYMAVAGVPDEHPDGPAAVARLALGMRAAAAAPRADGIDPLAIRVGVCTGPVIAGVIGRNKFAYDLWGDTVNTASRLESHAQDGTIQVCAATRGRLGPEFELSGPFSVELKGKGHVAAWLLLATRPPSARRRLDQQAA